VSEGENTVIEATFKSLKCVILLWKWL